MNIANGSLTEDEYRMLLCSKENWQKNKIQHDEFIQG